MKTLVWSSDSMIYVMNYRKGGRVVDEEMEKGLPVEGDLYI